MFNVVIISTKPYQTKPKLVPFKTMTPCVYIVARNTNNSSDAVIYGFLYCNAEY
jgi:hypothetical protein